MNSSNFKKRQLVRGKKLAKNRSIGEAELDNLQTNLAVSQSQLVVQKSQFNVAELNQERCLVRAPFDGIISQRIASEGEMLTVGSPIVEAVEIGRIEISADISLNDSASFEEAKEYYFESNGVRHSLVKRVLLPLVLNESRSRQARLDFIEPAAIAGMTGRLFWFTRERYLPANLLQSRGANRGFFIIENNKAKFIVIEGAQEGRPIKLSDQYSSQSAQLIIDGRHGLIDGQRVEVPNSGVGSSDEHSGKSVAKGGAQ
ncbi:MAG: HlyD family efflux transporter periplasmic adaptor subunit [Kangiellaceae bacterium]|nr:HlyD family efflux transporter periplasmic adaptor subunit [Kangiellaceae bacterium]